MNLDHPKKRFAAAILNGESTFAAAKIALGEGHPDLFEAATFWPGDLDVLRFQDALRNEGQFEELSKASVLRKAVEKFDRAEGREAASLLKEIADIQGWKIHKYDNQLPGNKIKVLDTTGELSKELEEACGNQQTELVRVANQRR